MRGQLRRIAAFAIKFQPVLARQSLYKCLIRVRFRSAQLVIEMNDGNYDAQFLTQLQEQTQQCNRINPA